MTLQEIIARALIAEYKAIWPGEWPAMPEALRMADAILAALEKARYRIAPIEGIALAQEKE